MKQKGKLFIVLVICFTFMNLKPIWGQNVKLIEKIKFSPDTELPLKPKAFCVTEDEVFIIPDYQAGNIKIYERNEKFLELVNKIGRKGYGPDEFSRPAFCFYNKNESKFVVLDFGIRKIFIYDRIGRIDFKRVNEVSCWEGATDIKLIESKLFVSGNITDSKKEHYGLYYIDLTKEEKAQKKFLLPAYLKYGLKSSSDFRKRFIEKLEIPAIGTKAWFDILEDHAYVVWEGSLKVNKLNIVSRIIYPFGMHQPSHYVKPDAKKLLDSYRKGDFNQSRIKKKGMSYVRNIITSLTNPKYVLVIYEVPGNKGSASNFRVQFYTLDGDFKREVPIEGRIDPRMWFDKDKSILYSLPESSPPMARYFILKYKIH